jgi:tetratricopeptide (TPR) repeat protein
MLGLAHAMRGQHDLALPQARAGLSLAREIGDQEQVAWSLWTVRWVLAGVDAFDEAERALRESVTLYSRIANQAQEPRRRAWSLSLLGYVLWRLDDLPQARNVLREALALSVRLRGLLPALTAVLAVAHIQAHQGKAARAVELFGLAFRFPLIANSRGWITDIGRHLAALATNLPPEVAEAVQARGHALDL